MPKKIIRGKAVHVPELPQHIVNLLALHSIEAVFDAASPASWALHVHESYTVKSFLIHLFLDDEDNWSKFIVEADRIRRSRSNDPA